MKHPENELPRWDQLKQLEGLHHGLLNLFSQSPTQWPERLEQRLAVTAWAPLVELREDDKEWLIQFNLPELQQADTPVSAEFKDGVLSLHLAKKEKSKPQLEQAVDEITAWWQKALGTKAVLGQSSNIPNLEQRTPTRKLFWTKPESGPAQPEINVIEATANAVEKIGVNNPEIKGRHDQFGDRSVTVLGRLTQWSGGMVNGAVVFIAIGIFRMAGALILMIRAGRRMFRPAVS